MTENEQIQEMAKIIGKPCYTIMNEAGIKGKECTFPYECFECGARRLFAKSYRKVERGEWIAKPQEFYIGDTEWMCSVCEAEFCPLDMGEKEFFQMMKYCPNCGADMRKEGEGDEK